MSRAVAKRLSGVLSSAFMMMSSSAASMAGFTWLGGTGCSWTCFMATLTASGPSNGSLPVAASYSTMPSE